MLIVLVKFNFELLQTEVQTFYKYLKLWCAHIKLGSLVHFYYLFLWWITCESGFFLPLSQCLRKCWSLDPLASVVSKGSPHRRLRLWSAIFWLVSYRWSRWKAWLSLSQSWSIQSPDHHASAQEVSELDLSAYQASEMHNTFEI